jgi:hypothetical protein
VEFARGLGMAYEEALAHFEMARHLEPTRVDRKGHRDEARRLFARVGAAYDLAELESRSGAEA